MAILIPMGIIIVFGAIMAFIVWRQDRREERAHQQRQ